MDPSLTSFKVCGVFGKLYHKILGEPVSRFCWKQRLNFDSPQCNDQCYQGYKNNPKSQEDSNRIRLLDFLNLYSMPSIRLGLVLHLQVGTNIIVHGTHVENLKSQPE